VFYAAAAADTYSLVETRNTQGYSREPFLLGLLFAFSGSGASFEPVAGLGMAQITGCHSAKSIENLIPPNKDSGSQPHAQCVQCAHFCSPLFANRKRRE
jgi:hypothetical protein